MKFVFEGESVSLVACLHERFGEVSKKKLKQAVEKKACRVNGKLEMFGSRKIVKGDVVDFDEGLLERRVVERLYEDGELIVVDKVPFMVVDPVEVERRVGRGLEVIHRLDKETSGVLVLAKGEEVARLMEGLFAKRQVDKRYLAIVKGKCEADEGVIRAGMKVAHHGGGVKRMAIGDALKAETRYTVVKKKGPFALVECFPKTGRTHQIRVHLESIGLSIVGDSMYGTAKDKASRMMLHCAMMRFKHPVSGEKVQFESELPQDFKETYARLIG